MATANAKIIGHIVLLGNRVCILGERRGRRGGILTPAKRNGGTMFVNKRTAFRAIRRTRTAELAKNKEQPELFSTAAAHKVYKVIPLRGFSRRRNASA